MAPQTSIPPAANVLGTIGTVCWSIQLIPQIWRNYRTKSTKGLPGTMMFIWAAAGIPFGAYAVAQKFNVALVVQPQAFGVLCAVSWAQCLIYGRNWRPPAASLALLAFLIAFAGIQTGLIFAIRPPYDRGIEWPVLLIGILAFILLIAGFLPIPFELIKRRGRMIGVDKIFLAVDWCGAFFSLMSLVAQHEFDVLFGTMYALAAAIEMSMFTSHGIWLLRTRGIRRRARQAGKKFDEFDECVEWESKGIDVGKNIRRLFGISSTESTVSLVHGPSRGNSPGAPKEGIRVTVPNAVV